MPGLRVGGSGEHSNQGDAMGDDVVEVARHGPSLRVYRAAQPLVKHRADGGFATYRTRCPLELLA